MNLAFLQVAVATVSAVYERNRPLAEQLLLWPITKPLLYMIKDSQFLSACGASVSGGNQWVLASEDQVTNCIEMLHKVGSQQKEVFVVIGDRFCCRCWCVVMVSGQMLFMLCLLLFLLWSG